MGKLTSPERILADAVDSLERAVKNYVNAKDANNPATAVEAYEAYYAAFQTIRTSSVLWEKNVSQMIKFLGPFITHKKAGSDIIKLFDDVVDLKPLCRDAQVVEQTVGQ